MKLNLHLVFFLIGHCKFMFQRSLDSQSQYKQKYLEFGAFNPIIIYINFQFPEKKNSIGQCILLT